MGEPAGGRLGVCGEQEEEEEGGCFGRERGGCVRALFLSLPAPSLLLPPPALPPSFHLRLALLPPHSPLLSGSAPRGAPFPADLPVGGGVPWCAI